MEMRDRNVENRNFENVSPEGNELFNKLSEVLNQLEERIENRLSQFEERMENGLSQVNGRLNKVEDRLSQFEERLNKVELYQNYLHSTIKVMEVRGYSVIDRLPTVNRAPRLEAVIFGEDEERALPERYG